MELFQKQPKEHGLDIPARPRVLTNKNFNDACNVMRKPDSRNANGMPYSGAIGGQQVSVIAQETLKLAAFLFHHR